MATTDTDRPDGENEQWDNESYHPFDSDPGSDGSVSDEDADEIVDEEDFDEPGELDLGDDDGSLPWLEGDDDFEDEGGGGSFLLLALLALGALGLIIGGIWWFTRDRGEADLIADGSVIEAPEEAYKEKPKDPGGKTFEGTGDTSYAVSEGETRTAKLGDGDSTARPGFDSVGAEDSAKSVSPSKPEPAAAPSAAANASSGPGVQVGAYSTRASAEAGWRSLSSAHALLSGLKYRVVEGKADIGTVFRLQALPGDAAAARALCAKLKAVGQDCAVKD